MLHALERDGSLGSPVATVSPEVRAPIGAVTVSVAIALAPLGAFGIVLVATKYKPSRPGDGWGTLRHRYHQPGWGHPPSCDR